MSVISQSAVSVCTAGRNIAARVSGVFAGKNKMQNCCTAFSEKFSLLRAATS